MCFFKTPGSLNCVIYLFIIFSRELTAFTWCNKMREEMIELLLDCRFLPKHVFHQHSLTLSGLFFSDVLPAPFPPPRSFPRFPFAALSNIKCDSKPQVRWVTTECGTVSASRQLNNKQWFAVFFHSSGSYGFPQFLHIAGGQGKCLTDSFISVFYCSAQNKSFLLSLSKSFKR